jgi:HAD superfamily hydrolase (TIGR01509 family)
MDGTLVETEPMWLLAETRTMTAFGGDWTEADQAACLGGPLARVIPYMVQRAGGGHDPAEVQTRVLDEMAWLLANEPVHWSEGARELLDSVEAAGIPMALVSASTRRLVSAVLTQIGDGHFDTTVAGDEVRRTKPFPDPYLSAAARLGVDPRRTVVLEDSPVGVESGLAAGAVVVAVPHLVPIEPVERLHVVASLADVTLEHLRDWADA